MNKNYVLALLMLACLQTNMAFSFELDLNSKLSTLSSGKWKFNNTKTIKGKGKPVHENLIVKSVLAADLPNMSKNAKKRLINELALGVRWNDDPLSMFREHTIKGGIAFDDSCKENKAKKIDVYWDLFYRTHCGDMQFLHAMASKKDIPALDTYKEMIAWLEFTYRVSTGAVHGDLMFKGLHYRMTEDNAKTFKRIMIKPNGERKGWRADGLFSLNCTRSIFSRDLDCEQTNYTKKTTRNIALGSLLHVLQDSYSESHTRRDDSGKLVDFGIYNLQDTGKHGDKDKAYYAKEDDDLIRMSSRIIESVIEDRKREYPFSKEIDVNTDSWQRVRKNYIDPIILPVNGDSLPSDLGLAKE